MSINIPPYYNQLTLQKYQKFVKQSHSDAKFANDTTEAFSKDNSTPQNDDKEKTKNKIKKTIKIALGLAIIYLLIGFTRRSINRGNELNNAFSGIRHIINDNPTPPPKGGGFNKIKHIDGNPPSPPNGGGAGNDPLRIICPKNNPLFKLAVAIKLTLKGKKVPEVVLPEDEFKKLLAYLENNAFSSLPENVRAELLLYLNKMPIDLLRKLPENVFKLLPKCQNIPYRIK